jgi:hypothetical protein
MIIGINAVNIKSGGGISHIENILVNLKGQPEIFLPISDPVISYYVTDA